MNIRAARAALDLDADVGPVARHVLLALACHADRYTFDATVAGAQLARETGLGRRSVLRAIDELEAAGLVKVDRRYGTRNTYHLSTGDDVDEADEGFDVRQRVTGGVRQSGTGRVPESHRSSATQSHPTSGLFGITGARADPKRDPVVTVDNPQGGTSSFLPGSGWIEPPPEPPEPSERKLSVDELRARREQIVTTARHDHLRNED